MEGKEIFNEILKSPKMKELIGVALDEEIKEDFDSPSQNLEVAVVRNIIEGQVRHTSEDGIFKNLKKMYDL